ncbi:chromosome segregation ATPase [Crocosphaera sp.]|uniref:chromosome segregation ATPase n=1 Tax=Crocosphaera sp. TaxID=2729996 RepID=UPI0026365864|nr:chromosome segregation ATPase [Crocosphaera sp.]MDJ0580433.1 chromosome segregation ATPase [Crocosphaera sp.]
MEQSTNQGTTANQAALLSRIALRTSQIPWQFWALVLIIVSGSVGFTATSMLLRLPKSPQCVRIFWPIASASKRIYCAQVEAEQETVDSFLKAIDLVEALPQDHPLRNEINRNVEDWALAILDIAEKEFQGGKLEEAIATARRLPENLQVYGLIEEKIEEWRSIWGEGEEIFAKVEEELRKSNWNLAFREAVSLLTVSNKYWATTRYDDTVKKIQLAQEESSRLDDAYRVLRRGGIDNWLQAIADAEEISPESYAYQEAQNLIADAKEKIVDSIDDLIDARRWSSLSDVVNQLPDSLALSDEIADWRTMASAGLDAQTGTVENLEIAILGLEEIDEDRPLYQEAQDLISRFKLEIQDVTNLEEARNLAAGGSVDDLNAAIATAEMVPSSNPRYQEARQEITQWTTTIQLREDQPILDKARSLARGGNISALRQAITQAQSIGSGRTLHNEAQKEVRKWRVSIQRQEDQPILNQAIALGAAKDYEAAIGAARKISSGRVLYQEAQNNINKWQREIRAKKNLEEAFLIAQPQTPQSLVSAIGVVRKIPSSTDVSYKAKQALDRWSFQLLSMAQRMANRSLLSEAVNLAKMIPSDSAAYGSAQNQINAWNKLLRPVQPEIPPSLVPENQFVVPILDTEDSDNTP